VDDDGSGYVDNGMDDWDRDDGHNSSDEEDSVYLLRTPGLKAAPNAPISFEAEV
jgi:hypothetical protein